MPESTIDNEVDRILNGDAIQSGAFSSEQEFLLRDSRFIATNLGTFFNTCIEQGIPSGLAEGMTYMMMGRFMQIPTTVQSVGLQGPPPPPPR